MQWRRFFTWTWAFDELDDSWTARLLAGRFVKPDLINMLARCGARLGEVRMQEEALNERAAMEARVAASLQQLSQRSVLLPQAWLEQLSQGLTWP